MVKILLKVFGDNSTYWIRIYRSTLLVIGFPEQALSVIGCVFLGAVFDRREFLLVIVVCYIVVRYWLPRADCWLSGVGVGGCSWFLVVGCRWLKLDPGCRVSVSVVVVGSWLSNVGIGGCSWFLVVGCRYRWLFLGFGVGGCSWFLIVGCRCQWLKLVPGCRVSIIGCQLSGGLLPVYWL